MEFGNSLAGAHYARLAEQRMDHRLGEFSIFPGDVHLETTARAQAFDRAAWPGFGQGGQKVQNWKVGLWTLDLGLWTLDFDFVALEEHLGDGGGGAKVAVYLERGMGVEQVGER